MSTTRVFCRQRFSVSDVCEFKYSNVSLLTNKSIWTEVRPALTERLNRINLMMLVSGHLLLKYINILYSCVSWAGYTRWPKVCGQLNVSSAAKYFSFFCQEICPAEPEEPVMCWKYIHSNSVYNLKYLNFSMKFGHILTTRHLFCSELFSHCFSKHLSRHNR